MPKHRGNSWGFLAKLNSKGQLFYSTYLGGIADVGKAIAADPQGNAYVTGSTVEFPIVGGFEDQSCEGVEGFLAKYDATGSSIAYSTYLVGCSYDYPNAIAVDESGRAYVTGETNSTDFPVTPGAFQTTHGGGTYDAFITSVDTLLTGPQSLVYSTFLGGKGDDDASSITLDANGNVYLTGNTTSDDFPTYKPFQATRNSQYRADAFVTELDSQGKTLVFSTYLGGNDYDGGVGIALDQNGDICLVGTTNSDDFPTAAPIYNSDHGYEDVFITKIAKGGASISFSTFLGGYIQDTAGGIAVDQAGNIFVTGETFSDDFPVKNAYQSTFAKNGDAFVLKINMAVNDLIYLPFVIHH